MAINDKFFDALYQNYAGSNGDMRKSRLAALGMSGATINDMEYAYLGSLGYTGALNDRWLKYLKALDATADSLGALSRLLSSTFYAGASPASYAANSINPDVIADFTGAENLGDEWYYHSGSTSTFDSTFTYTGASLKTMFDSDGALKWAPHNLLLNSEDASGWTAAGVTDDSPGAEFTVTMSAATSAHGYSSIPSTDSIAGADYTLRIRAKAGTHDFIQLDSGGSATRYANFDLANGTTGTAGGAVTSSSITSDGDGWYICEMVYNASSTTQKPTLYFPNSASGARRESWTAVGTETVLVSQFHWFRSDLGGMVNNPNRGDSYVKTSGSVVYMPRRNSYVYNGTSWVNRGIFLESEARTNTIIYSQVDQTNWTTENGTTTDAAATGIDGTTSAASYVPNTGATGLHRVRYSFGAALQAATATHSVVAKANGYSQIAIREGGVTGASAVFDLSDGTVDGSHNAGTLTVAATNVENLGDGWYRCSVTFNDSSSTVNQRLSVHVLDGGWTTGDPASDSFAGDGTSGVLLGHCQLEAGATPSSIIPTSGATATRAAETLTIAAANMAYDATAMSFAVDGLGNFAPVNNVFDTRVVNWFEDAADRIQIHVGHNTTGLRANLYQSDDVSGAESLTTTSDFAAVGVNVAFSVATRNGATVCNIAASGTARTEDTTPTALPDLSNDNLLLGDQNFIGHISTFRQWAADIGDTGIEEASA